MVRACPEGSIFLIQNTHPAGDKTDCGHGTYIFVCCSSFTMTSDVCTDEYSSDYIFSGGLDYSVNAYNDYIASETGGYTGEDKNGYDASEPCKSLEYDWPAIPTGLGYIAVYGDD
ncbi:hypothetical protein SLS57_011196 [Botryosphaeria dothidea]